MPKKAWLVRMDGCRVRFVRPLSSFITATFLLTLTIGSACSKGCFNDPHPFGSDDEALQIQLTAEPVSLDPQLSEDGVAMKVLGNTMDGLYGYDYRGELVPRLAKSSQMLELGRKWVVTLKEGVKWSDGEKITAEQFVAGFRRALRPKTASKLASQLFDLKNAKAFHAGKARESELGVKALSSQSIQIELEHAMPHFLHFLALHVAVPIREELIAQNGGKWPVTGPSTGPYFIEEAKPDQYLRLEPNVHHEAVKEKGAVSVILRIVQDESTGASLFERGILDILTRIPNYERPRFKQKGWVKADPFLATYYLGFNLKKAPFDDVRIRRAVSAAIKRDEIVKILDSGEKPSFSFIPDGVEGYDGSLTIPVNILKMDKTLAIEAGYDTSSRNALIMEKVQHDLLEVLGMKLALTPVDWKSYVRQLSTDPSPLWRFGIMAPIKDPLYFLQSFTTGDPANYAGFSDLEYDTWVSQLRKLPQGHKRIELLKKAQRRLVVEQAVVVPIYHYTQSHAVSPRVTGFHVNPFGVIRFSDLSITEN